MSDNASETDKTIQVKSNSSDKQSKNGDEQIQSMSVGEIDPAILIVREKVKITYSKEQLLEIRKAPASKSKPDFLDPADVSQSILDPEKWNLERKKSDTPENGSKDSVDNRRRPGDPRERIRKENDGIVLSPQRRSFNSGCFVPVNKEPARPNRPHSPLGGKNEPSHLGGREIQTNTRRIGSGRIMRDSWEPNEKDSGENDFSFGRGQSRSEREDKFSDRDRSVREENKFGERRSFGREIDANRDKEKEGGRRNGRYSERRRYSEHRDDEPEWFSSGPTSQNDTIELRGFDEPEKLSQKKKLSPSRVKRAKDWSKKKNESQASIAEEKEKEKDDEPKGRSTPNVQETEGSKKIIDHDKDKKSSSEGLPSEGGRQQIHSDHSFNFEEFLKCDSIPGLLPNGVGNDGDKATSRFSRWFNKDSPDKHLTESSRRSSIQEDHHIIKDLLKDINDSSSIPVTIHPPSDSNTYFAPISPAANTGGLGAKQGHQSSVGQSINIMEMLQRGKQGGEFPITKQQPPVGGKILSLDELESKIRHSGDVPANMQQKVQQQKPDEEMTAAFKRLMLNHSQQQDEARMAAAAAAAVTQQQQQQLLSALHAHQHHSGGPAHGDLTLKLQQAQLQKQQMDMLGKLAGAQMRASPLLDIGAQQSRELLNRPEAQAILQGLKRGEITNQHLYQQLANPALQPRHREMLVTILKLNGNTASYGPSPRVLSPVPLSHHIYQQPQQQLRVSPLPPNAMHQRIPSPRELQVHTQNILQRALIKKKLEEQSENYRKKQEMQRGTSPNPIVGAANSGMSQQVGVPSKGVSSPTPLAFTPTSVLRKMTADKDEGKENKAVTDNAVKPPGRALTGMRQQPQVNVNNQQWTQQFPLKQAGRPIVKANSNYQSQTADQFFAQAQAQVQQQPSVSQQRLYSSNVQQAQRKPIVGQQYSQGSQAQYAAGQSQYPANPQSFSQPQLTQQQLRAQHQHRPNNQAQQGQKMAFGQPAPQGQGVGAAWQQFLNTAAQQHNPRTPTAIGQSRPDAGALSPSTTDQLARWFSPDLLERARGGELPSTANLARHALSLEEIERQAAPPVHN